MDRDTFSLVHASLELVHNRNHPRNVGEKAEDWERGDLDGNVDAAWSKSVQVAAEVILNATRVPDARATTAPMPELAP